MSDALRHGGIAPQPRAGPAPRAATATTRLITGMVSPATPFVDPSGNLTPVGFRFLHDLLVPTSGSVSSIGQLQTSNTALDARVTALEAGEGGEFATINAQIATLNSQMTALMARVTTLEGQVATLTQRINNYNGTGPIP